MKQSEKTKYQESGGTLSGPERTGMGMYRGNKKSKNGKDVTVILCWQ
jgi:hypothetical protein